MEADGFVLVGRKGKARARRQGTRAGAHAGAPVRMQAPLAPATCRRQVDALVASMRTSPFWAATRRSLLDAVAAARAHCAHSAESAVTAGAAAEADTGAGVEVEVEAESEAEAEAEAEVDVEVVCYGLGSVLGSGRARAQLALLLLACEAVGAGGAHFFDPVQGERERALLASAWGLRPLEADGCRRACGGCGVFFMPHCEAFMYAALLEANAAALPRIVVVGNSFSAYDAHALSAAQRRASRPMRRLLPRTHEAPLPPWPPLPEAFNDTSVHSFAPHSP